MISAHQTEIIKTSCRRNCERSFEIINGGIPVDKAKDEAINKPPYGEEEFGNETCDFINSLSGLTPNQRSMAITNKLLEEIIEVKKILLRLQQFIRTCNQPR
jgi:hypothetical protein